MKKPTPLIGTIVIGLVLFSQALIGDDAKRLAELDAYWAEVSRAVQSGDFAGYKATCHPKGVLVNGISGISYPLTQALVRWKPGIDATRTGKQRANVTFRFNKRVGDETTAHDTGMFRYSSTDTNGVETTSYIHLEALLIKEDRWLIMMEYQKSRGTEAEWKALR